MSRAREADQKKKMENESKEAFKIIDMNREGNIVTVQQEGSGLTLCRHPDDLKPSKSRPDNREEKQECMQYAEIQWPEVIEHDDDESYCLEKRDTAPPPRRSQRKWTTIPVYNKKRALTTGHKYRASNSIIAIINGNGMFAWIPSVHGFYKKGKFWLCNKNNPKSCELFCPDQDRSLYETAMAMWRTNGPIHPVCDTHQRLARMKVVKDVSKLNFGRPFFVCCDRENPCEFWQWGDRHELPKPKCGHGLNACVRKVKKEGENQGRLFFCCPNDREKSCDFF
ncbi:endonuclease 8-like 3 [Paramuricea clavata]|uniref:Endonuclease 8-like 3, partial n=1 Tax=Paramuricea clavata TaxID=317549 RepID=A0A6S7GVG7_PARCT|nr:endonuclease 8-like 3 [Paramuricea clavata]